MPTCTKSLTISPASTGDMPLDFATYIASPSGGTNIYACRGPYLFKLDPITGAVAATERVNVALHPQVISPSTMGYNVTNDRLLFGGWSSPWQFVSTDYIGPWGDGLSHPFVYVVKPVDLSVESVIDLGVDVGVSASNADSAGIYEIKSIPSIVGEPFIAGFQGTIRQIIRWKSPAYTRRIGTFDEGVGVSGIDFDPAQVISWQTCTFRERIRAYAMTDGAGINWIDIDNANAWAWTTPSIPFGCAVATVNGDCYVGTQLGLVLRVNHTAGVVSILSDINTGLGDPIYKVRYNPYDNLLYCVCQSQNSIAIIDPGTDTLTGPPKVGFDCPVDVVFTPTKKFAVQAGPVGLKEIT